MPNTTEHLMIPSLSINNNYTHHCNTKGKYLLNVAMGTLRHKNSENLYTLLST